MNVFKNPNSPYLNILFISNVNGSIPLSFLYEVPANLWSSAILSGNISGNSLGLQHQFHIGGIGSLRGYDWKQFYSSHYFLSTLEIWFDEFGLFYDRALMFESPGNLFGSEYFNDLSENISGDVVKQSIGISIGDEEATLSFVRTLDDNQNTMIYLTFGEPLPYW